MKPENELLAEEVAFVNTCQKMAEVLSGLDRGTHEFEIVVHGLEGRRLVARFGTHTRCQTAHRCAFSLEDFEAIAAERFDQPIFLRAETARVIVASLRDTAHGLAQIVRDNACGPETQPLTLEEFDKIVRTGEAELPPVDMPPLDIVEDRTLEQQRADGDAPEGELPPMVHVSEPVAAEMQRLEEELPFEVPYLGNIPKELIPDIVDEPTKTPKRKGK
jgi:hypothetical protein